MAYLYVRVGDPLAFSHIQASGWGRTVQNPFALLWDSATAFRADPPQFGPPYRAAWTVLGLAAAGWLLVTRRLVESWLCAATVLIGVSTGNIASTPRFVASNPAFVLAAADILAAIPWRYVRAAILVVLAAVQVMFVLEWYRGAPFLF
jgi:hypothetical protein